MARNRINLCNVRQISAGYLVGPITHPTIKRQLNDLRAGGRRCHLLDACALDYFGTQLLIGDTALCENARLHDYPPLYVVLTHYSQTPEIAEYLRREILAPAVSRRFGKEDFETHFRLFAEALSLEETRPEDIRVAGYYDRPYGYMVELYADPVERTIDYFNLGPEHLIERGHCSYPLGQDIFALISCREIDRVAGRIMAIAWCRSAGHPRALRDLERWQKDYDRC